MEFYEQGYDERLKAGNISESKAEEFYKSKNIPITRCGFNEQDKTKNFYKIPNLVRSLPDYVIIPKKPYFLEVKGCTDRLKVKLVDMKGYDVWNKIIPIIIFAYSSSNKHCYRVTYQRLKELLDLMGTKGTYPDNNKEYLSVEVKELALIGEFCKI